MTSRDFCFWLQGFFEIADEGNVPGPGSYVRTTDVLSERQVAMVRRHLALVFKHEIDPSMPDPTGELQAVHDGAAAPGWPEKSHTGLPSDVVLRC